MVKSHNEGQDGAKFARGPGGKGKRIRRAQRFFPQERAKACREELRLRQDRTRGEKDAPMPEKGGKKEWGCLLKDPESNERERQEFFFLGEEKIRR